MKYTKWSLFLMALSCVFMSAETKNADDNKFYLELNTSLNNSDDSIHETKLSPGCTEFLMTRERSIIDDTNFVWTQLQAMELLYPSNLLCGLEKRNVKIGLKEILDGRLDIDHILKSETTLTNLVNIEISHWFKIIDHLVILYNLGFEYNCIHYSTRFKTHLMYLLLAISTSDAFPDVFDKKEDKLTLDNIVEIKKEPVAYFEVNWVTNEAKGVKITKEIENKLKILLLLLKYIISFDQIVTVASKRQKLSNNITALKKAYAQEPIGDEDILKFLKSLAAGHVMITNDYTDISAALGHPSVVKRIINPTNTSKIYHNLLVAIVQFLHVAFWYYYFIPGSRVESAINLALFAKKHVF